MRDVSYESGFNKYILFVLLWLSVVSTSLIFIGSGKGIDWVLNIGLVVSPLLFCIFVFLIFCKNIVLISEGRVAFSKSYVFWVADQREVSVDKIKNIEVVVNDNFYASSNPSRSVEIFFNLKSGEELYIPGLIFAYPESVERIRINYLNIQARLNLPSVIYDGACKTIDEFCEFENQ